MTRYLLAALLLPLLLGSGRAQTTAAQSSDSLGGHRAQKDRSGNLLAWYQPGTPGAAYAHVSRLAAEFIKSGTPVDHHTGLKMYLVTCCFDGPHKRSPQDFAAGKTGENWMHNPACVYAGMVQSLVLDYMPYSGDTAYVGVVREMLDYQLANGTTPAEWPWGGVPYASADPFEKTYQGATKWENEGMRGDGLHGVEPDKIGEMGYAYLKFYQVTGGDKYLKAALACADALAKHVRPVTGGLEYFSEVNIRKSPWPFRLNARTGQVHDEYTANVVEPVRLFDELLRTGNRLKLDTARTNAYGKARELAWKWLFSKSGPMKTYIWNGYFEDIGNDPDHSNRVNNIPLETARYLLKHPETDPDPANNPTALVRWVASVFGTEGTTAIREQTWCFVPMGSHTARYASLCALLYERTGDPRYQKEAADYFNWATYATDPNGVVRVGPTWPGSWFSDGYGDYIKHFMEGLAAVPAWAPAGEDHLLRSTSAVQQIAYGNGGVRFRTYDDAGSAVLRLAAKPKSIKVDGKTLPERKDAKAAAWTWEPLGKGGIVRLRYAGGHGVEIN